MPRLQALIDEIDRWVTDHGPVTYDGTGLWGEITLKFREGERVDNYEVRQMQKLNGRKRDNPSDKRGSSGELER